MRRLHLLTIFTGVMLCSIHSKGQIILNPSFESPSIGSNNQRNETAGDDWTVSGTPPAAALTSNDYNDLGETTFGSQYLDLYGPERTDPPVLVSQLVSGPEFVAGKTYTLDVDYADLSGAGGSLTLALSGDIFLGATLTKSFAATAGGPYGTGDIPFQTASFTFIPFTSGTATVTLEDLVPDGTLAIDDIFLVDPSVPEPTAAGEVLLGFGALAGVYSLRRGRQA
jgi:hypothetical protein